MGQLVVRGDDDPVTRSVKLGSASSAENLKDVQDSQVDERTPLGVVYFRALDDDPVGRKVDAPGQGGCADQYLDQALTEQFLDEVPVCSEHAGMMDPEAGVEELHQLLVSKLVNRSGH